MLDRLVHSAKTQCKHRCLLVLGIPNRTADQCHKDGLVFIILS